MSVRTILIAGDDDMSSVSGLEREAEDADLLPLRSPTRLSIFGIMASLASFASMTASTIRLNAETGPLPSSAHACPLESTSRRSRAGWRNFRPIRLSMPIPRATSWTSQPMASQRFATSLIKVILVARNALAVLDELGSFERRDDYRSFYQIKRTELLHYLDRIVFIASDDDAVRTMKSSMAALREGTPGLTPRQTRL